MASLYERPPKHWNAQIIGLRGRRPVIRLGKIPAKAAQAIRSHIENLVNAQLTGQPAPRDTAAWVAVIGEELHKKLVKAELVAPRENLSASTLLGPFLEGYISGRTDLKPRTIANLKQVKKGLVAQFGERKHLGSISKGDIADWHRKLKSGLARATLAMHVKKARQMFADAFNRRLISENPLAGLKAGSMENRSRFYYVPVTDIIKIIGACPDAEWRLIFALARFGGLRVPSEIRALRWPDVDWNANRITIHSPKTEHHEGMASRQIPIFAELLPYLQEAWEQASGNANVIAKHRGENLRTSAGRIIEKAGVTPWGKLFQNMRSSRETDLAAIFPLHVACAWIGNSESIARKHYLQVTDEHFAAGAGQSAAQSAADGPGHGRTNAGGKAKIPHSSGISRENSTPKGTRTSATLPPAAVSVSRRALHKALHRLGQALPHLNDAEKLRLQAVTKGGGR